MSARTPSRGAGAWIPDVRYGEPGSIYHLSPDCTEPYVPETLACPACPDAPVDAPAGARTNKYPGPCARCLDKVPARTGALIRTSSGTWAPVHFTCP